MIDHSGKVAIVTGASRGIGAATARELIEQGCKVALLARTADQIQTLAAELGSQALAITCDVADYASVAAATAQVTEAWGRIDFLINNAGIIDPIGHFADISPADWAKVIDVNVKGVAHCCHAVIPTMTAQGAGVIVNVSSGAASSTLEGWTHYCASKAAVLSMTKCLNLELSAKGIHVVGMSPGTVATYMQTAIKASGINPVAQMDPAVHIPASWPARAISFLCSPEGRAFDGNDFRLKADGHLEMLGLV